MKRKTVRQIAEAEGVLCTDCIHEALMTIGKYDFDLSYRIPKERYRKFVQTLHEYDQKEH